MASKTKSESAGSARGGKSKVARTPYEPGTTRRQRQDQYRRQMRLVWGVVAVALVLGGLIVFMNWRGVGTAKAVSCADFPDYCVPFAGGNAGQPFENFETAGVRTLDAAEEAESEADAPNVVRGVTADGMPFIGNPDAPIQIAEVADYACPHCQNFHYGDLGRIMDDLVLTGQASFQVALTTGTGGVYSEQASQVALCAGEQGAFWEMNDELYRLARSQGVGSAFTVANLLKSARDMGLDDDQLRQCLSSGKYRAALLDYSTFASNHGVTGTPTVLVNFGQGWRIVSRDYNTIADLVQRANAG